MHYTYVVSKTMIFVDIFCRDTTLRESRLAAPYTPTKGTLLSMLDDAGYLTSLLGNSGFTAFHCGVILVLSLSTLVAYALLLNGWFAKMAPTCVRALLSAPAASVPCREIRAISLPTSLSVSAAITSGEVHYFLRLAIEDNRLLCTKLGQDKVLLEALIQECDLRTDPEFVAMWPALREPLMKILQFCTEAFTAALTNDLLLSEIAVDVLGEHTYTPPEEDFGPYDDTDSDSLKEHLSSDAGKSIMKNAKRVLTEESERLAAIKRYAAEKATDADCDPVTAELVAHWYGINRRSSGADLSPEEFARVVAAVKRVLVELRLEAAEKKAAAQAAADKTESILGLDLDYLTSLLEQDSVANLRYGVLFLLALSSLGVYSIILAGWSSNSKYAFIGALRSAAQMISYEVAISLIILPVVLLAGSLNLTMITHIQNITTWFLWPLLPISLLFLIAMLAETNRTPFDLPEAEAELVAGYNVDYSSLPFAMFFLGEYCNMILISTLYCILFLGGGLNVIGLSSSVMLATKAAIT